ncbi:MAG: hypothetical protein IK127_07835 [Clostridia bacterium]|nr:hypothetical protein [Clostridia bacterium]
MYCKNCGAVVTGGNFCQYCGEPLTDTTASISLMNKAVSTANLDDQYNLVLVSCGTCNKVMTGDLLEDVFGYTDAESTSLVNMAPVVVGERLNANEAATVAQLFTEYGVQVSITNQRDQYVDLTSKATTSVFDSSGNLLTRVAAVIGALTVANRIRSYRRYKKPSLLERLFHVNYQSKPPVYQRNFRPRLVTTPVEPRHTIRKSPLVQPASRRPASPHPVRGTQSPARRPSAPQGASHSGPAQRPSGGPSGHKR